MMVMHNTKTLRFATLATLSLGVGASMAQESPGGADVNSQPAYGRTRPATTRNAPAATRNLPATAQPQTGASDPVPAVDQPYLIGGDGNA